MSHASMVPTTLFNWKARRARQWCLCLLGLNIALLLLMLNHGRKVADVPVGQVMSDVDRAVEAIDMQDVPEMGFQKARWILDYEQARTLSQKTRKPIFMFTMKGSIDGRC